jgi:hypothetical protein
MNQFFSPPFLYTRGPSASSLVNDFDPASEDSLPNSSNASNPFIRDRNSIHTYISLLLSRIQN